MAKTKISQFDATAANNTDLNSISIAEGTAPSNINNAIRELMSQLADLNLGNEVLSTLKIDNIHLDGNTIVTLDTNGDLNLTPNGTGSVVVAKADINGGAIDGTPIGAASASTGAFTTLSANSTVGLGSSVTISGGNIDGVIGANTPAAITGTVITANTNFAGNLTGNVTGTLDGVVGGTTPAAITGTTITANTKFVGAIDGNVTATSGTSTFNNVTINGTLDMDSTTSQTITGLATPSGSTDAATKGYVDTEISGLVDSAPAALNTLNELAAALGDDASFSTTVTNSIAAKLPLAGGTMTGDINANSNTVSGLKAPSSANDATTKTYVDTADALKLNLSGGTLSGNLAMGSNKITGLAAPTDDNDAARKKYVDDIAGSGTAAATSASQAATSATNAASSATAAASSATAAASSATSAAASYDSFDDRYLGAKSSAPTVDNDGDALVTGALYWNTTSNDLFVWNGSAWEQGAFSAGGVLSNVVEDTTPQLGGDLDVNGQNIVSTSNADIDILPNGSGKINLDGNGSSGGVTVSDGLIDIRTGTGAVSKVNFYCESSNAHAQTIQAQPHSAGVTNVLTLPAGGDQEIVGASATQTLTNKTIDAAQLSGTVADARLNFSFGTSANNAVKLDSSAKLPAVDGSALTNMASGGTVSLVADGNITAGKPVILTSTGKAQQVALSGSTSNLDNENYLGIAAETISDTNTGKITVNGGVNENQTGLTIGDDYFTDDAGVIRTFVSGGSALTGGQFIGKAIAADKLLLEEQDPNIIYGKASNTIAKGNPVLVETDGDFAKPEAVSTTINWSLGSVTTPQASITVSYVNISYNTEQNKFAVFYEDRGASDYLYGNVLTNDGTTLTAGSKSSAGTNFNTRVIKVIYIGDSKHLIFMRNDSNNYGVCVVATVSGTSITYGTPLTFQSSYLNYRGSAYYDTDKNVAVFVGGENSSYLYLKVWTFTVSGTTVTQNSSSPFNSSLSNTDYYSASYDTDEKIGVIAYRNTSDDGYVRTITLTSSGDATFNTAVNYNSTTNVVHSNYGMTYDSVNKKTILTFGEASNGYLYAIPLTVSGTGITAGTKTEVHNGNVADRFAAQATTQGSIAITYTDTNYNEISYKQGDASGSTITLSTPASSIASLTMYNYADLAFNPTDNVVVSAYRNGGDDDLDAVAFTPSGTITTFPLTTENFIGLADNASSSGDTAKVRIGGVDANNSGLTAGQLYFVKNDGTLSTTAESGKTVEAGKALSATKLLVNTS